MQFVNSGKLIPYGKDMEITADGKTDFFVDTLNGIAVANAPFAFWEISGDFIVGVCVEPEFRNTYDAGGIFVYESDDRWIKLEFELTDLGYPSIVSVITDGASDDANGERMDACKKVYLQIIRKQNYWALHHSLDGTTWKMARYFRLDMKDTVKVGFEAQSPVGDGTRAKFTDLSIRNISAANLRAGQ